MGENLFIFISQRFIPFDRTAGRNIRMKFNEKYRVVQGSVSLSISKQGTIIVKRFSQGDVLEYEKEIAEPGMYVVTSVFTQQLPDTEKMHRALYNRLRDKLRETELSYKLIPNGSEEQHNLALHIELDKMWLKETLYVNFNPKNLTTVDLDEIVELTDKILKNEFRPAVYGKYCDSDLEKGVIIPIEEFF